MKSVDLLKYLLALLAGIGLGSAINGVTHRVSGAEALLQVAVCAVIVIGGLEFLRRWRKAQA